MRWLDAADQARLRSLSFVPRRPASTQSPGRHRAAARGASRDFATHRPYAPGDEARAIDWKAYARLDRFFVRDYRAEDRASWTIVLDASASMGFSGAGRPAKFDLARRAAAGLAWLALAQGDEAGLLAFGGARAELVPPRAGAERAAPLDAALSALELGGESEGLARSLEAAAARLPPRSGIVLVSDLLGDSAEVLHAMRRLAAGRRELRVLRALDPDERDFPYEGALILEGLEGGELALDAAAAGDAYRAAFARQDEAYRSALRRASVPYAVAWTDAPWTSAAARLLA